MTKKTYSIIANSKDTLGRLYDYDEQKFRKAYMSNINNANQRQLAGRLILSSHSLEKSLSNDGFEVGHGFKVSRNLVSFLQVYNKKGYDQSHLAYVNTLSVLRKFQEKHYNTKFSSQIEQIFGDLNDEIKDCKSGIGGADVILYKDKMNNSTKNFKELANERFAVRSYSDKKVDRLDIRQAVEIAMKTPTVCNRQSIHVYEIYQKDIIEKVLKVQGGMTSYATPPVLLLITADDSAYVNANERNQGFIDGGLFAMSILYALEYKKIAACPLHAMLSEINEKTIRGMLDLSEGEKLITFISAGHFRDTNGVCKSFRYDVSSILEEKNIIHDFIIEKPQITPLTKSPESMVTKIKKHVRVRTRLRAIKTKLRIRTRLRNATAEIKKTYTNNYHRRFIKEAEGAIVTLTGYFNYGNIIQRYALQRYLLDNGHKFVSYAQEPFDVSGKQFDRSRNMISFVESNITRKVPEASDTYRTYITGSDQVWRKWGSGEDKKAYDGIKYYFFDFLEDKVSKRIAYAASFGMDSLERAGITSKLSKHILPLISKFDAISVREESAVDMIKDAWGKDSTVVVDPTMLLSKKHYSKIIDKKKNKLLPTKGLFCYIIALTDGKKNIIGKVSKHYKIEAEEFYLKRFKVLPPVEQWLKGYRDSEFVVTDSFHGIVFSIINNTPFIAIENEYGGNTRMTGLLNVLGLEDRIVSEASTEKLNLSELPDIKWESVNLKLKKLKEESESWLLDAVRDNH